MARLPIRRYAGASSIALSTADSITSDALYTSVGWLADSRAPSELGGLIDRASEAGFRDFSHVDHLRATCARDTVLDIHLSLHTHHCSDTLGFATTEIRLYEPIYLAADPRNPSEPPAAVSLHAAVKLKEGGWVVLRTRPLYVNVSLVLSRAALVDARTLTMGPSAGRASQTRSAACVVLALLTTAEQELRRLSSARGPVSRAAKLEPWVFADSIVAGVR